MYSTYGYCTDYGTAPTDLNITGYHKKEEKTSVADPDPSDPYLCFLGLLDPDPDPIVRGTEPDPGFLSASKHSKKNLNSYCFVTSF
jgi:hypothetical protein